MTFRHLLTSTDTKNQEVTRKDTAWCKEVFWACVGFSWGSEPAWCLNW